MTLISAYIDLFIREKNSGVMSGYHCKQMTMQQQRQPILKPNSSRYSSLTLFVRFHATTIIANYMYM